MLKKNKKFFIASCIVILLPMFAGFLLWDQLPAQVATHFGRNGEADRYSSKLFAVAGIYLFLLAVHILCSVITEFDPMYLSGCITLVWGNDLWKCIRI